MNPDIELWYWPALLLGSYLLGAIPFSQVLARARGVDLRTAGSGNVGAGNLARVVGKRWGAAAGLLDGLKGVVPVYIAGKVGLGPGASGVAGVCAVVGHNWSIFMRGRSGRGLATSAGVIAALDFRLLVWTSLWAVAGWKIGGGIAGFIGWGLLPVWAVAWGLPSTVVLFLVLLSVIVIGRRMQGNPGSARGLRPALRRALYDTDPGGDQLSKPAREPLTP